MSHRSIEEVFREIAPAHSRGIPAVPTLTAGVSSSNGADLGQSLTQAGQEIAQLRQSYQQQQDVIAANTQALQGNTAAQSSHSASSTLGGIASTFLHGITGLVSPVISGIASLFGGGSSAPPPALPVYKAPPSVAIDAILGGQGGGASSPSSLGSGGSVLGSFRNVDLGATIASAPSGGGSQGASTPPAVTSNITVNVNAMDSQSFMDRSSDIASAVREAMLNNHPINSVVADL